MDYSLGISPIDQLHNFREQQTVELKTPQKDQEIQVEIYDEEDDGMYDLNSESFCYSLKLKPFLLNFCQNAKYNIIQSLKNCPTFFKKEKVRLGA